MSEENTTPFDWNRDRKLQFMIKLNGALLVDPRTPQMSGIGAVKLSSALSSVANTPQVNNLSLSFANNNNNANSSTSTAQTQLTSSSVQSPAAQQPFSVSSATGNANANSSNSQHNSVVRRHRHLRQNSAPIPLNQYCFYIKWSRGSWVSGKFAPFPLNGAVTRDDGRIEFVLPPADTHYEISFPVDFGSGAALESKKFTVSVYILRFTRAPMDPFLTPKERMQFFRNEDAAGKVIRSTIVEGYSCELTKWLVPAKPLRRRQIRLDFTPHELLVMDYAIFRQDDLLPPTIQALRFDGITSPAASSSSHSQQQQNSINHGRGHSRSFSGQSTTSTLLNNNTSNLNQTSASSVLGNSSMLQKNSSGSGNYLSINENASSTDSSSLLLFDESEIVSEPDLRPGLCVTKGRSDIFKAISFAFSKAALEAKLPIGLTELVNIFETGNRSVLKLPGLSTNAAFSLLLSNDSPFLSTFHEKRQDRGFITSPWKNSSDNNSNNTNTNASNNENNNTKFIRLRTTGYEMRFGSRYMEAKEHSFVTSYYLPSPFQQKQKLETNYLGQFHVQGSGIASAVSVELAIHIGAGLLDSIVSSSSSNNNDDGDDSSSSNQPPPMAEDGVTPLPCCTVHFAIAVVFSSPTIEGQFRKKADAMIPKMLNALSTTAKALLGADDLSRQAQDAKSAAEGKAFLKRTDARVSVDPLLALRPFSMKSNACIAQHFLKLAVLNSTSSAMRPKPANLELIACLLTMHLKYEPIVRLAMEVLDRCIARHGRGVAAYCPGLADAVERARQLYSLPPVEGGLTALDSTIEQLLDRQVYEDIKSVGIWKVLEGKSRISLTHVLGLTESSFFMGDIHRVRVILPALKELFEYKAGIRTHLQLSPEQVNILVALVSLHLNCVEVVDTVTFALERTSTTCLVASASLQFVVESVYKLYPQFRNRLENLRNSFNRFQETKSQLTKEFSAKFGSVIALADGDPIFRCKITLYQPVDEGECDLILTRKSFYIGSIAFPLEHLYTITPTRVYLFFPAIRVVSQKPKISILQNTNSGKEKNRKEEDFFEPLRDDLALDADVDLSGGADGGGGLDSSLLEGCKTLDAAFKDLDSTVAANFGGEISPTSLSNENNELEELGNYYYNGGSEDQELDAACSASPETRGTAAPHHHQQHNTTNTTNTNKTVKTLSAATTGSKESVAVTFLAKCWETDELFEALESIGYGGRITNAD